MKKHVKYAIASCALFLGSAGLYFYAYNKTMDANNFAPTSASFFSALGLFAASYAMFKKASDALDEVSIEKYRISEKERQLEERRREQESHPYTNLMNVMHSSDEYSRRSPALDQYEKIKQTPVREGRPYVH